MTIYINRWLSDEVLSVLYDAEARVLRLVDSEGLVIAEAPTPGGGRKLSNYAFGSGAQVVKHEYNLRVDELDSR